MWSYFPLIIPTVLRCTESPHAPGIHRRGDLIHGRPPRQRPRSDAPGPCSEQTPIDRAAGASVRGTLTRSTSGSRGETGRLPMSPTTAQCQSGADTSTVGQALRLSGIRCRSPRSRHEARQSVAGPLADAPGGRSAPLGCPRSARVGGGGSLVPPDAAACTARAVRRTRLGVPLRPFKSGGLQTEHRKLPSHRSRHPPRATQKPLLCPFPAACHRVRGAPQGCPPGFA